MAFGLEGGLFGKSEPESEDTQYVIEYASRPPMRDAGIKRKTYATGDRAKRATQKAIRDGHGVVLRTRKVNRWGW